MRSIVGVALGAVVGVAVAIAGPASAQKITPSKAPAASQNIHVTPPKGRVAEAVRVPAGSEMIYISGQLADPIRGDTRAQALSVFGKIKALLADQGYSMGDVVMLRVLLVGDPAKGGAMDFAGLNAAYDVNFGPLPGKPARITSQSVALTEPGALVEIEAQAARHPAK